MPFDIIDVAQDSEALERMRELVGDEEALAPQIANGEEYCGVSELGSQLAITASPSLLLSLEGGRSIHYKSLDGCVPLELRNP